MKAVQFVCVMGGSYKVTHTPDSQPELLLTALRTQALAEDHEFTGL